MSAARHLLTVLGSELLQRVFRDRQHSARAAGAVVER
jgi:hypothetical protein